VFLPEGSRVTVQALTRFFEILGEANVPPLQLGAQLARIAGDYVELKTRLRSVRADDPTVAALREEAASLIEAGEFETARARLGAAVARSRDIRKEFEARARESRALEATTE
jgi:hypothetical protein